MAIIRDVKVLQKSEQKQDDFSPVRLLVSLRDNHILLIQCVCDPAGKAAVKVKDSIVEMDVAHVGFYFLYYDIPGPGPGRRQIPGIPIPGRAAGALYNLSYKCAVVPDSMYRGLLVQCRNRRDKSRDLPFHPEPKNILIP